MSSRASRGTWEHGRRGQRRWWRTRAPSLLATLGITLLLLAAPLLHAREVPPAPTQWLTDSAGILTADQREALNNKLRNFEQQSGASFIVYTLQSLEGDPVEDFTVRAVEKWKVGQRKYDNGLVLFVFVAEKKVRIEVGYGLEGTITDAFSSGVIRDSIAPHFKQGDYAGGLNAGVDALTARILKKEAPVPPQQRPSSSGGGQGVGGSGLDIGTILFILFIVFFVVVPMFSRRRSGCGGCFLPIFWGGGGGGFTMGGGGFGGGGFGGGGGGGGGWSGGGGRFGGGGATGGW